MSFKSLTPDLVSDPRLWRLALALDSDVLNVMAYSIVGELSVIACNIPLTATDDHVKSLEDAVYDNQLLLQDFDRIDILIHTDNYIIVPSDVDDEEVIADLFRHERPSFKGETIANRSEQIGATVVTGVDAKLLGFLRRTFFNPRIMNWIYPQCAYFGDKSRAGNDRKMYAHFRDGRIDITAFSRGKLLMANTFTYRDPMDAVYFIMAARQSLDFDQHRDPLLLVGDTNVRDAIVPTLREYVALVMPVIFPSTMSGALRQNAADTPFPLILTPLCE